MFARVRRAGWPIPERASAKAGKKINLNFTGKISCVACDRNIKKTFNQGYCFPCLQSLAQCDTCIMKPELCHFDKGTCREPEWGLQHCFKPHYIYLANSSGIKVGITRETQIPIRWRDQGAIQALPIIKVQSRFQSGLIEIEIAKLISDKTNWRKMLKNEVESMDLIAEWKKLLPEVQDKIDEIAKRFDKTQSNNDQPSKNIEILSDQKIVEIEYPVLKYPEKVTSLNFDKTPFISGTLQGIKGQYLIFDIGVINIRKFSGYQVEIYS